MHHCVCVGVMCLANTSPRSPDMVWVLSFGHRTSGVVLTSGTACVWEHWKTPLYTTLSSLLLFPYLFLIHFPSPSLCTYPPPSPSPSPFPSPPLPPLVCVCRSNSCLHSLPSVGDSIHRLHLSSQVSRQPPCPLDLCQVPHGPPSLLPHGQWHQTPGQPNTHSHRHLLSISRPSLCIHANVSVSFSTQVYTVYMYDWNTSSSL